MKNFWQDKVVLITGSTQGIGRTLAAELGTKGASIILNGRNAEKLSAVASTMRDQGMKVLAVQGDVASVDDCRRISDTAIKEFGRIDVLVNNAGTSSFSTFATTSIEVLHRVMNVNLLGVVNITKAVFPYLLAAKGRLFFVGSVAGVHGIGSYATYSSSKMALLALAESLRIELHDSGVKVGIAFVGFTENDDSKTFMNAKGDEIGVPDRKSLKKMSQLEVAHKIIRMLESGTFRRTFTPLGKLTVFLNTLFPGLIHRILLKNYRKITG